MPTSVEKTNKGKRMMKVHHRGEGMTRLDRIKSFYFQGVELSDEDDEFRSFLERINAKLEAGYSKGQVTKFFTESEEGVSRSKAYQGIRDSLELFGDVFKANKNGLRHVLTEQFMLLANIARNQGDLEVWRRALESVVTINNLKEPDKAQNGIPRRRIAISYTTDPQALQKGVIVIEDE